MTTPAPLLLTLPQAAARLGVGERWLADQVRAHAVPCTRLSRKVIRFSEANLAEFIAARQQPVVRPGVAPRGLRRAS